ncbi:MAG: bifunctional UDP-N-acetylglucosamine diphosphorylase/glucosamine-1-phosphate N-acetyltransferase GlmU [Proteobacteria bacterium]|nr:bifunctional UDP-N-acetylglucosamine diphosphorylase/glucosamine-1-phosphate N-acetyltransferase GlmU [Pseudomonadota bacterium]
MEDNREIPAVIILAAGKGTRMNSAIPKVLHKLRGKPLLNHLLKTLSGLSAARVMVVTGSGAAEVEESLRQIPDNRNVRTVRQEPQSGTGHAVAQCLPLLEDIEGSVLVLSGDTPGVRTSTLLNLDRERTLSGAGVSLLVGNLENPRGYGRILREPDGKIVGIREQKDLEGDQDRIREVNLGVYSFDASFLRREIPRLDDGNAQKEYYLTDLVGAAARAGVKVVSFPSEDSHEAKGINTLSELADMEAKMNANNIQRLMDSGVRIVDPDNTWIDDSVSIEPDAVIHPMTFLRGTTRIGSGTVIEPGAVVTDSVIGRNARILPYCVISGSEVGDGASVGPFSHMRPGSRLGPSTKIGNFVETKKVTVGEGSKVSHLTYIGDAEIGEKVNIGAGCVTCNYDGFAKYRTVIQDGVFVGSGTMIVAPVTLGKGSLVAAGSTITRDVAPDALAVARARQSEKEGWAARRRENLSGNGKKDKS